MHLTALVLTSLVLSSALAGQNSGAKAGELLIPGDSIPDNSRIALARCQYTPADDACRGQTSSDKAVPDTAGAVAQAQFPRHMPGPPAHRPPAAYGRRGYPGMGGPTVSGRHMLIGALVGFGLGAAAGAKANTDPHPGVETKAVVLVGSVGGVLGALVGAAVPAFSARPRHWHHSWPDDEDVQAAVRDQGPAARGQPGADSITTELKTNN